MGISAAPDIRGAIDDVASKIVVQKHAMNEQRDAAAASLGMGNFALFGLHVLDELDHDQPPAFNPSNVQPTN